MVDSLIDRPFIEQIHYGYIYCHMLMESWTQTFAHPNNDHGHGSVKLNKFSDVPFSA